MHFFNMIEILLALTVIAIGMTSVLGLFPVGLKASRQAIAQNMSADVAEQMVTYMRVMGESSATAYDATFVTAATNLPIYDDNNGGNPDHDNSDNSTLDIYTNSAGVTTINLNSSEVNIDTLSEVFLEDYKKGDINTPGTSTTHAFTRVADKWAIFKPAGALDLRRRVYFIVQGPNSTEDSDNRNIDYSAMALVWKDTVQIKRWNGSAWGVWPANPLDTGDPKTQSLDSALSASYDYSAKVNVELSWPLELPYKQRNKRYYQVVINKP
jgi:Tfp pilus assembly protein PilV